MEVNFVAASCAVCGMQTYLEYGEADLYSQSCCLRRGEPGAEYVNADKREDLLTV